MPNIIIKVVEDAGKVIEVAAEDVIKFAVKQEASIQKAAPTVLAALAVLAAGIEKAATDVATDAANPVNILLGGIEQGADFIALWPDLKAFIESLGITKI